MLLINGLDTTDGKLTLLIAIAAMAFGLLVLRGRGREALVASVFSLAAGLAISIIGGIDIGRGKSQFIARLTRGLKPYARAAERAVAERMFESGALSIQARSGVILVLAGGCVVTAGAIAGALAAGRRARPVMPSSTGPPS